MRLSYPPSQARLQVDYPWWEQTGAASSLVKVVANLGPDARLDTDIKAVAVDVETRCVLDGTRGAGQPRSRLQAVCTCSTRSAQLIVAGISRR
jgi:hypothetical protein